MSAGHSTHWSTSSGSCRTTSRHRRIFCSTPSAGPNFAKLKTGTEFNSSLLGAGTTDAQQLLLSLPVIVDPAVPDYSGVVVDQRAVVSAVGQVKVATSEHQYFSSDSVLLRATWRFGHVVVRPDRLGVFTVGGGS